VPCFNVAGFLPTALSGLTDLGPDLEVLVVDDGSTDTTASLADQYAARHPGTIRVIHQPNRGHGGAVNAALDQAAGTYFKVLDADDSLDRTALAGVLVLLRHLQTSGGIDLLISNYVFESVKRRSNRTVRFTNALPDGRVFSWSEVGRFKAGQFLMMHALAGRSDLLRQAGFRLPEKTYYADHMFVAQVLPLTRRLYYSDTDLYRYRIGHSWQSVSHSHMIQRLDQQLEIARQVVDCLPDPEAVSRPLYNYLVHHADILCALTSALLSESDLTGLRPAFWEHLAGTNPALYRRLRRRLASRLSNLPGKAGRRVAGITHRQIRRTVGFS
jgi:hypothetical protein